MIRAAALCVLALAACDAADPPLDLEVWHGETQRVGHLGDAQDDFNLMGAASARRLTVSVNGGSPRELTLPRERFGFRRLGAAGHFNADVPVDRLAPGSNELRLVASNRDGSTLERVVTVERLEGDAPLPFTISWSEVDDPQDVGQYVDGRWELTPDGLRSPEPAYDRLFLIGNRDWRDYEVTTSITLHAVAAETGPYSGGNGVGIVARFAGHSVGGPLDFPDDQPKWGYLPFGHIAWLRWRKGAPEGPTTLQSYRGDRNELTDHGTLVVRQDERLRLRLRCETRPDAPDGAGVTRYAFRVWPADAPEPGAWAFDLEQRSDVALRAGGVALVAHHVDVTFGDVLVAPLP